jgi:hypothetical protein
MKAKKKPEARGSGFYNSHIFMVPSEGRKPPGFLKIDQGTLSFCFS